MLREIKPINAAGVTRLGPICNPWPVLTGLLVAKRLVDHAVCLCHKPDPCCALDFISGKYADHFTVFPTSLDSDKAHCRRHHMKGESRSSACLSRRVRSEE